MAENILIEGKRLEELEREITCGICQEYYTEPKILPCLHYYCKQCVLRLATRTGLTKPFSCPECRGEATLPEGGVDELKTAFFINRLKTTVSTMERAYGKVEVKCELCSDSEDKAEAFCRQCAMFICTDCIRQHKRLKTYLTHEVTSLEDLKQGRAEPIVKEPPIKRCPDHEEPLMIYCFKCEQLICHLCTVVDHHAHNFDFCKKSGPKTKETLLRKLQPLSNQRECLAKVLDTIQTTKLKVKEQQDTVANNIRESFKELHNILDRREQELLKQVSETGHLKIQKLSAQEKKLSVASAEVQSVVDYTEQCVRHCTDNEMMSIHTEIRRLIDQKIEEHSKSERTLQPVEEADIGVEVRCAEALQQLCQTQANITLTQLTMDQTKCTVTLEDDKDHEVNKLSTAVIVTRCSDNKISRRHHEVSCSLRSLYNNVSTQCKIDRTGSGQYSIQYTPTVRGRHELTVSVDGQQVAGSPFPVFASIHPTLLDKPVKVWRDVANPRGITMNSAGEILVCTGGGNIFKFGKDGGKIPLLKPNKNTLCKIEVDDKKIYCIDYVFSKILKCNHDGSNEQVVQGEHMKNGLCGLAVVGGEVLISEYNNKGTVMVYDKDLKYVRRIEHPRMGEVTALSSDCHGNLYCADKSNHMIHVFSNDGVFMHSFGCDEEGKNRLNYPRGLCVSGHYVYVCNFRSDNISVFTTDGVYVTFFGQHGSEEGDFKWPHSVCADKDGLVYVTDYNNARVQCF